MKTPVLGHPTLMSTIVQPITCQNALHKVGQAYQVTSGMPLSSLSWVRQKDKNETVSESQFPSGEISQPLPEVLYSPVPRPLGPTEWLLIREVNHLIRVSA